MKTYRIRQTRAEKAKSNRGRASRRKGAKGELETLHVIKEVLPPPWEAARRLQAHGGMGAADVEVYRGTDLVFHVESKLGKKPNIRAALAQAIQQRRAGALPVARTRADREDAMYTVEEKTFLLLLNAYCHWANHQEIEERNRDREEG